jgi:hypothetical protein
LLVILAMGTAESSLIFHHSQKLSGLSRETANRVSRECITFEDQELNDCVNDIIDYMELLGNRVINQFQQNGSIIVSVWKDPTPPLPGENPDSSNPAESSFQTNGNMNQARQRSRYGSGSSQFTAEFVRIFNLKGNLVVAEISYKYNPKSLLGPLVEQLLSRDPVTGKGVLYEASIF